MKCIIFSNGELFPGEWSRNILLDAGLIIAADGGARHAIEMNLHVNDLVGDMDSISELHMNLLKNANCKIHRYPEDKNKTDLELAIDLAILKGALEIHILGAEGGRLDHMLGNALISTQSRFNRETIWFYGNMQRSVALHPNQRYVFKTISGKGLSIIPLNEKVEDFSIEGVRWPLKSADLNLGSTFTISNKTVADEVVISFKTGTALLILEA